jgi:acetoacetyl-CoA synthetase
MLQSNKSDPIVLWEPTEDILKYSGLVRYQHWLESEKGLVFPEYYQLWKWSVDELEDFWRSIRSYFPIIDHGKWTSVLKNRDMPGTSWFPGSRLNYAEHIFLNKQDNKQAILFKSEHIQLRSVTWARLRKEVAAVQHFLRGKGVVAGDRVAGYLPTIPEATVAFLATISIGAIWSCCSPEFGSSSVVDRFKQIKPKVLITADGYRYGGKPFDKSDAVNKILKDLESVEEVILVPYLNEKAGIETGKSWITWDIIQDAAHGDLFFEPVSFEHPLWVLYSSGTTGRPKAITHSHGGMLLEHLKYLAFHNDVRPGERFFWYSTTGWMMWNFVQAAFLVDATIVLYDGSPGFPDLSVLWDLAEETEINHFGTSAPFLVACMKSGINPSKSKEFPVLRSVGSTGSPLPPEAFRYVYENIKSGVWLSSISGGTDLCTAFVGGCPTRPVYMGEIQARSLGCSLLAYNEKGKPVFGEVGEMVITEPMPSMPIYFWDDPDHIRYKSSYFGFFPGVWRHGDWIEITPRDSLIIYGRSDATLNRQGVRIGTSEIYRALDTVPEIRDSLVIHIDIHEKEFMPLFVVLKSGSLTTDLEQTIKRRIREMYSPRHVPDRIIQVDDVPYTLSGKKMETPVKRILMGYPAEKVANLDSMRNPEAMQFFVDFYKKLPEIV